MKSFYIHDDNKLFFEKRKSQMNDLISDILIFYSYFNLTKMMNYLSFYNICIMHNAKLFDERFEMRTYWHS